MKKNNSNRFQKDVINYYSEKQKEHDLSKANSRSKINTEHDSSLEDIILKEPEINITNLADKQGKNLKVKKV